MTANSKNLFESMTRRRVSCPQVTQQLWDAIKSIRCQRQIPTAERIAKIMLKDFNVSEEEVTRQLNHCVRDGLIEITKRTVNKGNFMGSEQEGYKLPLLTAKSDEYDWYCFDCHRAGDVICCSAPHCFRVYHLACISSTDLPEGNFVCHVCKMCEVTPDKFQIKRSKMNRMLGFTLQMLKSKYPLTLKDQRIPPPNKNVLVSDRLAQVLAPPAIPASDESEAWRTTLLIAKEMNLLLIEDKIDRHRYKITEEFHADCLNILHNMVIYNGVDSAVADIARQMLRDCVQDLNEMRQCVDCYKNSHGDKKKLWFCKPCRKPHDLVYAKQSGFPYWPAKVIKINGDDYDVRFFGAQHLRATIPRAHIRPISVNIHSLQVKRSSAWNRACEELKKHNELLEKARLATNNFTKFQDSSSSSEYETIDTDHERRVEKETKQKKYKLIMEKHNALLLKQKIKRRRSSSVVPATKTTEKTVAVSTAKKRGRPTAKGGGSGGDAPGRGKRRPRKEVCDISSDSMDSFNFNNSKNDSAPKRDNDEIFNELLKSETDKQKALKLDDGSDAKSKKVSGTRLGKLNKQPKKDTDSSDSSEEDEEDELSSNRTNGKKAKSKSEAFDSSTVSSVETFDSGKRRGARKSAGSIFGMKDKNESQDLTFERIAQESTAKNKKNSMKKIYTSSSSEADDESEVSSRASSDSEFAANASKSKKPRAKIKKLSPRTPSKKSESQTSTANLKAKSQPLDLDSNSSDSDSESSKNVKTTKKTKPATSPAGKKTPPNKVTTRVKKKEDSSDSEEEEKPKVAPKGSTVKKGPQSKTETKTKAATRVSKTKKRDSSDSETPLSANSKSTRSKVKDTSESTDMETPVLPQKKQLTRSSTKKDSDSKTSPRPAQRASQRNLGKTEAAKHLKAVKEACSSDSETPLSQKTDSTGGKEQVPEISEMYKKYVSMDMDAKKKEEKKYESSDSEEPLTKTEKLKIEASDSGSDTDKKQNLAKKSKTELLEEKVQKIKKQKNIVDDKKKDGRKKEEIKEETVVSSSSQEPITKSVCVQTLRSGEERTSKEGVELQQKVERISELEKELQAQLSSNKLLEVELNKTRVLLDRARNDHEEEIAEINSKHGLSVSEIKKKQWCYNCETEAIYHCCWNTAYCSVECQQAHWQSEHKRVCRRKR